MSDLIEKYDGRPIVIGEELHEVRGKLVGKPVVQLRSPSGDFHEMPISEFHVEVGLGNVLDRDPDWNPDRLKQDAERFEQDFRLAVIAESNRLRKAGYDWDSRIKILRQEFETNAKFSRRKKDFPTKRTIQIWEKAFRESGSNALADKRYLSGNRAKRHDPLFEEIVFNLLEERYLTSDRYTVKSLASLARAQYLDRCKEEDITPSDHGEKVVRSLIATLPHRDIVLGRLGRKEGDRKLIQARRFEKVISPLERVEIDSTLADIYVVIDDEGNRDRPWICAAIDCATGVIVGMTVTVQAPNASTTVTTLKEVMTPTSDEFFDRHEIKHRFQAFGRPLVVVSDHGSENSGLLVEGMLENTGIEFRKTIPGKPEKKPYIERFMSTLKNFVTQLPGASQTREMPNKTRVSKGLEEAFISFDEFANSLQKWRFDVYAHTDRRRIQSALLTDESPYSAWRRLSNDDLVPEPPTPQEIKQMFFAGTARRKLFHYGVEYERIQYFDRGVRELLDKYGPGITVDVRFDPTDIRTILIRHPSEESFFEINAKDPEIPALSFEELKLVREKIKLGVDENLTAVRILEAITEGFHHKARHSSTKARAAKHEAIQHRKDQEIIERSLESKGMREDIIEAAQSASRPIHRPVKPAPVKRRKS